MILCHQELLSTFKKGLRTGNWKHLNPLEKALYRASLWYAKHHNGIVNTTLGQKLSTLVEKLQETNGTKIFKRGFRKAMNLLEKGEEIFVWAPQLKFWLKDPDYIFWLGTVP